MTKKQRSIPRLSRVNAKSRLRQVADYVRQQAFGFGLGDINEVLEDHEHQPFLLEGKPGYGIQDPPI